MAKTEVEEMAKVLNFLWRDLIAYSKLKNRRVSCIWGLGNLGGICPSIIEANTIRRKSKVVPSRG